MFQIIINELASAPDSQDSQTTGETRGRQLYSQTVDVLDVGRVIALINTKPRAKRGPNKARVAP